MQTTLLLSIFTIWFNPQSDNTIKINVTNIKKDTGYIMIAVYDKEDNFLTSKVATAGKFKVSDKGSLTCELNIPFGDYAVSIFHDEDADGSLSTNMFKIPNEPIGFSNNPSSFFGPPSFKKARFTFQKKDQQIDIKLN